MKYPNIDEFTKVITLGTVDRSKKIFFPAKTLNGISGVRIASLLSDNHGNNYAHNSKNFIVPKRMMLRTSMYTNDFVTNEIKKR